MVILSELETHSANKTRKMQNSYVSFMISIKKCTHNNPLWFLGYQNINKYKVYQTTQNNSELNLYQLKGLRFILCFKCDSTQNKLKNKIMKNYPLKSTILVFILVIQGVSKTYTNYWIINDNFTFL